MTSRFDIECTRGGRLESRPIRDGRSRLPVRARSSAAGCRSKPAGPPRPPLALARELNPLTCVNASSDPTESADTVPGATSLAVAGRLPSGALTRVSGIRIPGVSAVPCADRGAVWPRPLEDEVLGNRPPGGSSRVAAPRPRSPWRGSASRSTSRSRAARYSADSPGKLTFVCSANRLRWLIPSSSVIVCSLQCGCGSALRPGESSGTHRPAERVDLTATLGRCRSRAL